MAAGDDSSVPLNAPVGNHDVRLTANGDIRPVTVLGNAGDRAVGVMPWGALETFTGLSTLLYDPWSASPVDTVDKWTVTGTAPTIAGGNMTFAATAGYHAIRAKEPPRPNAGFTLVRNGIWLEAAAGTGSTRYWGLGIPATTPSATVMAQEGVGFEVDQAGALSAVVYSAGAKTHTFPLTRPSDGAIHAYEVQFRVTGVTWHIDNLQVPVAAVAFPTIAVVELPALLARFNVGTPAGVTYTNIAHLTADTSRQGMTLMDPVIGTRQARVSAGGALWTLDPAKPAGAPVSNPVGVASSIVLAANVNRSGLLLVNSGTTTIYLNFNGTAPTTTLHSWRLDPGDRHEMLSGPPAGEIRAIGSAAAGTLLVTELT